MIASQINASNLGVIKALVCTRNVRLRVDRRLRCVEFSLCLDGHDWNGVELSSILGAADRPSITGCRGGGRGLCVILNTTQRSQMVLTGRVQ